MNCRYALLAVSIFGALLSLALVMTAVGATSSSVRGEAIAIEADALKRDETDSRLLAYQSPNISQGEILTLTEPISIYLPVMEQDYIDPAVDRAALMALYGSTNGEAWHDNTGWGTDSPHCEWFGVTCDENEHVTILYLAGNGLTGPLPPEIGSLVNLQELDLWWNQLTSLPIQIGNLESLQVLVLGMNQISTLPSEIGNLANLLKLNLDGNQLVSLPTEIGKLAKLLELYLDSNQLASLPAEFGNLENLQELHLGNNHFTSVPSQIGNLTSLQGLVLDYNQIMSLPPEIGNLVNLKVLYLTGNQLTSLPAEIGNLVNLREFGMGGNGLAYLPSQIGSLVSLQAFYLWQNQLVSLPPEIGNLTRLGRLSLSENQLSGPIPAFLSNLGSLSALHLWGNPELTCWETQEALDWALSLNEYYGPTCCCE